MSDLKPCPFCGAVPRLIKVKVADIFNPESRYMVKCESGFCRVRPQTELAEFPEFVVKVWNWRDDNGQP